MSKYIKQLTRENTLLDRAFRTLAYAQSIPEVGQAKISKSPVVGFGKVTSLYYDPIDYKKQQSIIVSDFKGKNVEIMARQIIYLLECGYNWVKNARPRKLTKRQLAELINYFEHNHAYARGAIVYGYWGEPVITEKLRSKLSNRVNNLDEAISLLSVPQKITSSLTKLHKNSDLLLKKKQKTLVNLKLSKQEKELVNILSWFTLFYEIGERVAGQLYSFLLRCLAINLKKDSVYGDLAWYDPAALKKYLLSGEKLSKQELNKRRSCYILLMQDSRLKIISGAKAVAKYNKLFKTLVNTKTSIVKGTVACSGLVTGTVKIVITENDQKKFKKGNILVSTMTTPNLMSAIRKAAAIVTDEGGMTAHAAIISRELNIPCVVGTKIATSVFKDGDRVEVDAERGIIKKIK